MPGICDIYNIELIKTDESADDFAANELAAYDATSELMADLVSKASADMQEELSRDDEWPEGEKVWQA